MPALTAAQMGQMQATQTEHMMDRGCVLAFHKGERNIHNVSVPYWARQPDVACGFQFDNQTDEVLGRADVPTVDAQLRLPAGTKICSWDRFRLTHRLGVELAEYIDFEIHGEPKIGPSGIVCELMQAKDVTRL